MSTVTKEKIEHLQDLINRGKDLLQQAAQYAGENNIPLKHIDDYYEEPEEGEEEEEDEDYDGDGYGPKLRFGGQGFTLDEYNGHYHWHNSNCF
jgi:hypothetical protein